MRIKTVKTPINTETQAIKNDDIAITLTDFKREFNDYFKDFNDNMYISKSSGTNNTYLTEFLKQLFDVIRQKGLNQVQLEYTNNIPSMKIIKNNCVYIKSLRYLYE